MKMLKLLLMRSAVILAGVTAAGLLTQALLYVQMHIESAEALSRAFAP